MFNSIAAETKYEFKRAFSAFDWRYTFLILAASAAMIFGMMQYVTPLEKAKEQYVQDLMDYPLDQFMKEERAEINERKRDYVEPLENAMAMSELDDIMAQFEAELGNYPTRESIVEEYAEALKEPIEDIYSDKDKEKANALIDQFRTDAAEIDDKDDLYNMYSTIRQQITTDFQTKEQVQKEKDEVAYLVGTWQIPGSYEYPFALYSGGGFEMPIKDGDKTGSLTGSWSLSGDQVYIYISKNSLNANYKPFTWVFDYNTVDRTLEGTGDYFGWIYHRVS